MPSGVLSQIPEREHLKRSIRRERTRNQLPDPTSIDELGEIPERYKRTQNGENFLIYDNFNEEEDTQRVIVFGTKKTLESIVENGFGKIKYREKWSWGKFSREKSFWQINHRELWS